MTNEFKVGDRVRVVRLTTDVAYIKEYLNKEGIIHKIERSRQFPVQISFLDKEEECFVLEELELVDPDPTF